MKRIDQSKMSARGFISAAYRVLKAAGFSVAHYSKVASYHKTGIDREGVSLSRVGYSNEVSIHYYIPNREGYSERERERLAQARKVLEAAGVTFNHYGWVECASSGYRS